MTHTEHEVLAYLERLPAGFGQTTEGIYDRLDLSLAQVRRALTSLRKQGLVTKRDGLWVRR